MIQLTAQVTDINTGGGLPGATIAVNGTPVGQTDGNGNFTVPVNSMSDTITISSVGYGSLTQAAGLISESGLVQLSINPDSLPAVTVTPSTGKGSNWLILAGIGVVALSSTQKPNRMSGKGSTLLPIALLGVGAFAIYELTKAPAATTTIPGAVYAPTTGAGIPSIVPPASGLSSIISSISNLFGGSKTTTPGFAPIGVQQTPGVSSDPNAYSPAGGITTINPSTPGLTINPGAYDNGSDYSDDQQEAINLAMSGVYSRPKVIKRSVGDTSDPGLFSADQIVGKTLIAATNVPVYNKPGDSQQPVGTIAPGNPIGVVYSWEGPDPGNDMQELWWMFEAPNDNYQFGDSNGFYFVPHKAGYFNVQDLVDQGALTAAQATAIANGTTPSTAETLLNKYLPWVIGGLVAVGLGKAVINKVI